MPKVTEKIRHVPKLSPITNKETVARKIKDRKEKQKDELEFLSQHGIKTIESKKDNGEVKYTYCFGKQSQSTETFTTQTNSTEQTKNTREKKDFYQQRFCLKPVYYKTTTKEQIDTEEKQLREKIVEFDPIQLEAKRQRILDQNRQNQLNDLKKTSMTICIFNHKYYNIAEISFRNFREDYANNPVYITTIQNMLDAFREKHDCSQQFCISIIEKITNFKLKTKRHASVENEQIKQIYLDLLPNIFISNCYQFIEQYAQNIIISSQLLTNKSYNPNCTFVLIPEYNRSKFLDEYKLSDKNTEVVVCKAFQQRFNKENVLRLITASCKRIVPCDQKVYIISHPLLKQSDQQYKITNSQIRPISVLFYSFWAEHDEFPFYTTEFQIDLTKNTTVGSFLTNTRRDIYTGGIVKDLNISTIQQFKDTFYDKVYKKIKRTINFLYFRKDKK